jgi:aromatic-L-amino-acid/L-tryptophan decarboxylase
VRIVQIDLDEFRRAGHRAIDLVADYLESLPERTVQPTIEPGSVRAALPTVAPETPESWDAIFSDVESLLIPALSNWQSPGWFAYFPATSAPPAIIGELLSAGFAQQGMLWATSPACTELETQVMDWLAKLCDLPAKFHSSGTGGGVIQDSASSGSLVALIAARERVRRTVADIPLERMVAYTSSQTHSSVVKDARIAGFGHIREVEVDATFAMRPAGLESAIAEDRANGLVPAFVCATIGTTSSGAVDPVRDVARIAERERLWCHVDAAWAGAVGILPEHRQLFDGLELVDSYLWNPHKWLMVNFDCTAFWIAERREFVDTFSIVPAYLRNDASASGDVIDYRDWQVPLGRRFRALKLWLTLRSFGAEALRGHLREHIELAADLDAWLASDRRFVIAAPRSLALVCFAHRDGDDATQRLVDALNASGRVYLGTTRLDGRLVIRVAIGSPYPVAERAGELRTLIDRFA